MEKKNNAMYMKEWIQRGEDEKKQMMSAEKDHTAKLVQNSIFLKEQMGVNPLKQGKIQQAAASKTQVRGAMNEEEIRINKGLLKEIHDKKKVLKSSH